VTKDPGTQQSADDDVQEYERLRDHVLSGATANLPWALVVLLRHGLAVWSTRRRVDMPATSRTPRIPPSSPPHRIVDDRHAALVPVLLDMVLATHQEVHL
jgi:hypothetical protein